MGANKKGKNPKKLNFLSRMARQYNLSKDIEIQGVPTSFGSILNHFEGNLEPFFG